MTTECCGNGVMTPVIWLVAWLLQAHSAMCDLPAPVNVTLSSSHFVHLLKWDPGPESPGGVYYLVKVCSDGMVGEPWEVVAGCEHVEFPLECNLTKAFSSRNHIYYNQVFTVLGNQVSLPAYQNGFKPITDTHLDPPVVSVRACDSTLCVGLRPPVDGLRDLYDRFHYKFNISSSTRLGATFSVQTESLKGVILKDLAPGREYCVSVSILDNQEIRTKSSSYSQPHCAFTAAKETADTEISVVLCLLVLFGLCAALLVHTGFICLRQPLPEVLSSIQHKEENLHPVPYDEERCLSGHVVPPSPPSGSTGKDGASDEEGEGETEGERSSGGGQGYKTRGITADLTSRNPLSSSSSSSSSRTEVFLHPYPKAHFSAYPTATSTDTQTTAETESNRPHVPVFITSDQQPTSLHRPDRLSMSLSNNHPLSKPSQTSQLPESAWCASRGQVLSFSLSSERDTGNVEGLHPGEEEEEEGSCLDVNLLSVTLSRHEEMMEPEHLSVGEPPEPTTPFLPSDTKCWAPEPVTTQTHTATSEVEEEEEEEEEEDSGYMRR
ncbi:uncharacterized protein LOC121536423 [Coregonus clupeaformis]|uniref:uncharacterized protein LOC121536423 n=1 Tax=Coregonus clupeaformis TaxID=59861 RepID=UPI001BE098E0|nr:uncharacterized protein LOC121536423 [Coregonus clupeaformis]